MVVAKPFVKWVGGKTQLLSEIEASLPKNFDKRKNMVYVEPFVGGGAVMFWILEKYPNITKAVINDINKELICTYLVIKNDVESLISELQVLQSEYIALDPNGRKDFFIQKRAHYNTKNCSDIQTASLFIFLNKTCFNGLYRVNAKGAFNVPHGKYANPRICDEDNLRAASEVLQKVEILCGDFAQTLEYASENALFYFDPPYKPLSETSSFTSYAKDGFGDNEQIRLKEFCDTIASKKSLFVASNSDLKNSNPKDAFFDKLYECFQIKRVLASRMINSEASGRGKLTEIMITNVVNILL